MRTVQFLRNSLPPAILFSLLCAARIADAQSANPTLPTSQTYALTDTRSLVEQGVKAEIVEYRGRKAVRLTAHHAVGNSHITPSTFPSGSFKNVIHKS